MADDLHRGNNRLQTVEQPRHPGVVHQGDPQPQPGGPKKPYRDQTWTEKWLVRRQRWLRVMPGRLDTAEKGFNNLLKVADREYYEFTNEEAQLLVARLRAWVDALDVSLRSRKPLYPRDLPSVILDHSLTPPERAIPPAPGLEDIWGC